MREEGKVNCAVQLCLIFTFILTLFSKVKEVMRYKEQMSLWKCWKWKFKIRKNNSLKMGQIIRGFRTSKIFNQEEYEHDMCLSIYFELEARIYFYWSCMALVLDLPLTFMSKAHIAGFLTWGSVRDDLPKKCFLSEELFFLGRSSLS